MRKESGRAKGILAMIMACTLCLGTLCLPNVTVKAADEFSEELEGTKEKGDLAGDIGEEIDLETDDRQEETGVSEEVPGGGAY